MPGGREEDVVETSQDGLLEEMCSKARVWRVGRRSVAGANPNYVAKEDQRTVDRQSPKCDEKAARRLKMGARKKCTTLVGQTKRSVGAVAKKKARKSTGLQIPEGLGTWDKASKGDKRWQRGITSHHPLCESGWRRSHPTVRKWESEKRERRSNTLQSSSEIPYGRENFPKCISEEG